ncbi:MAG TPA: TolC family outer membrane protein [Rhodanobacteraceae bacterium]
MQTPKLLALAIAAIAACAAPALASAENLMDVYRQALQQDPILKQAMFQQQIGHETAVQSRAILLPQLSGGIQYDSNRSTETETELAQAAGGLAGATLFAGPTGSRSRTDSLNLTQVLFDLGKFSQLRASKAAAAADTSSLASAEQDLMLRVATAYFTILTDEDQLKFVQANAEASKQQLDQTRAKFKAGLTSETDVSDFQSSYDTAVAQVIAAKDEVYNDRLALAQITGQKVGPLASLQGDLPLTPPAPNNIGTWIQSALARNPALAAQRHLVKAARDNVTVARSGHLPTINASVSYARIPSWGPNLLGTNEASAEVIQPGLPGNLGNIIAAHSRTTDTAVGVVLTVPLFSGGGVAAGVGKAIATRNQANQVLVQNRRSIVSNTQNAFTAIHSDIAAIKADRRAVASAKAALASTIAGHKVGTQSTVNVLFAQEAYLNAESAYSQVRHALVIERLTLKFEAGTLSVTDLEAVNRLLE